MFTLEQKVDLVMRYIASAKPQQDELKKAIVEALNDTGTVVDARTDVANIVVDIFKEVGVPPHLLGYERSIYAIELAYNDPTYLKSLTKRLYPDIAAKYDTTPSRVERTIRHAVEVSFDRGDVDAIYNIFGNTISVGKGKLTNGEFLAHIVVEVRRRLNAAKE